MTRSHFCIIKSKNEGRKRNSRNHLFRDYGSKGRGREAHSEFLVVWVVQTCWGVVKTFFEVVLSSGINTTFIIRFHHRQGGDFLYSWWYLNV